MSGYRVPGEHPEEPRLPRPPEAPLTGLLRRARRWRVAAIIASLVVLLSYAASFLLLGGRRNAILTLVWAVVTAFHVLAHRTAERALTRVDDP